MFTETFLQTKNQDCLEQVLSFSACKELANVGRTSKTLFRTIFKSNEQEGNINLMWQGAEHALTSNPAAAAGDEVEFFCEKARKLGPNAREHSRLFATASPKLKAWSKKREAPIEIRFVAGKYARKTGWIDDTEVAYGELSPVIVDLKGNNNKGLKATSVHTTSFKKIIDQKVPTSYAEAVIQRYPDIEQKLVTVTRQMAMCHMEKDLGGFHELISKDLLDAANWQGSKGSSAGCRKIWMEDNVYSPSLQKNDEQEARTLTGYTLAVMQQHPDIESKLVAVTRQIAKCGIERDLYGFIEVITNYFLEAVALQKSKGSRARHYRIRFDHNNRMQE